MEPDEKKYWLDDPRNVTKIFRTLCGVCAALFLADLFYHKDVHFNWERWIGFYGVYGFVCCVVLVLTAKQMRKIVKRDEDHYDR